MTAPTYQATGTAATNATGAAQAVSWPTHATGDIGVLICEATGSSAAPAAISGWNAVASVTDVATTAGSRLSVWWRRATSAAEAAVTVPAQTDHIFARIVTVRGAWDLSPVAVTTSGTQATASTTATVPGVTTTRSNELILGVTSRPDDSASTTHFSALTNVNLASLTEQSEAGTTNGDGGGFVVWTGIKRAAGAVGNTTMTKAASTTSAHVVLSFRAAPPIPALVQQVVGTNNAATSNTAWPSAPTPGNTLVCALAFAGNNAAQITVRSIDDDGDNRWVQIESGFLSGQNTRIEVWAAFGARPSTSVDITTTGTSAANRKSWSLQEWTNLDPLGEAGTWAFASGTAATNLVTGSYTPPAVSVLALATMNTATVSGNTVTKVSDGFTDLTAFPGSVNLIGRGAYRYMPTPAAITSAWTASVSSLYGAGLLGLYAVTADAAAVGSWGNLNGQMVASTAPLPSDISATMAGAWGTLTSTVAAAPEHPATLAGAWGALAGTMAAGRAVTATFAGSWGDLTGAMTAGSATQVLTPFATESFNTADQAGLGPDLTWTRIAGTGTLKVTSQTARVTSTSTGAHVGATSVTLPSADQYATVDVVAWDNQATSNAGLFLRSNGTVDLRRYLFQITGTNCIINRYDAAGTSTQIASGPAPGTGTHSLMLTVIGSTITGYIDGVAAVTVDDTTIPTGSLPGIRIFAATATTGVALDNFATGTVSFTATANVSATASGAWGALTSTGTAVPEVTAALSGAWGALTGTATALPTVPAALAGAWGALTSTATATVGHDAALAGSWALSGTAAASVAHSATLAGAWGFTGTAAATVGHDATIATTFGFAGTIVATRTLGATALGAWGGLTATGTALPEVGSAFAGQWGALGGAIAATPDVPATLAGQWGGMTATVAATVGHPAALAATWGPLTGTATATLDHPATLTVSWSLAGTAVAGVAHDATALASWGQLVGTVAAAVTHPVTALGAWAFTATVAAVPEVTATAAGTWGPFVGTAEAVNGDKPTAEGRWGALAANITAVVQRSATLAAQWALQPTFTATPDHPATAAGAWGALTGTIAATPTVSAALAGVWTLTGIAAASSVGNAQATLAGAWGALTATGTATVSHDATAAGQWGALAGSALAHIDGEATAVGAWGALSGTVVATRETTATALAAWGGLTSTVSATPVVAAVTLGPWGALTGTAAATVAHDAAGVAGWGTLTGGATATPEVLAVALAAWALLAAITIDVMHDALHDSWTEPGAAVFREHTRVGYRERSRAAFTEHPGAVWREGYAGATRRSP
jgi:hypothetical protein